MGEYRELEPRPHLRDLLSCVWYRTVGPDEPAAPTRVLPDACVDIVWSAGNAPLIAGPDTQAVPGVQQPGSIIAGVRFRPGRAPELLGVSAHALRDGRPDLAGVWGAAESRRLSESDLAASLPGMLDALQDGVERRLDRARPADLAVPAIVEWAAGTSGLHRLTDQLDLGERQLRRRVEERFGYGPLVLRRVLRLQRLLALAAQHRWPLATLALEAGYADQAHMTRECGLLAGLSPRRLLADRLPTTP